MRDIKRFLVCGGGMMGSAIAQILAGLDGAEVTVYDVFPVDVEAKVRNNMKLLVEKGVVTEAEVDSIVSKISFTQDMHSDGVKNAQFVVECVLEEMEMKQNLFAQLEEVVAEDAIFCTNTSVMSPTEIASKCKHKERLCGTHFWNPAFLIPLVEVVKTPDTTEEVAQTVMDVLTAAGKKPVLCKKDVPGFIANRMQHALWREAISIVERGIADAKTVDDACKYSFGLRLPYLPPLVNSDMVSTQLTYNIHSYVLQDLEDRHDASPLLKEMIDAGKMGFRAEAVDGVHEGFMKYTDEEISEINNGLNEYLIKMLYGK
ncbi:3-hydroxybutyryl-CoA dehydrogenase [uncultured Roseburia sp.]|uniref:3-hydroxyacyl-CoA dehydrogenase family protein n=1 Tax=Brotonthovivens ammoniilytica TaxID=2981725 RepID=A0ABT2TGD1_9FIRM|nr:3-hydroxyacyl-CoA dehydrogenase family protein [Brotonthovivens ammoniilytica]MCU6760946.1 3-hydroxyacyl-CoA dehydrogenase family protein [Brotonthovivens ammoniilytica]SCI14196.1 3-hydroxybutyryl-CoA dehydrogenase [uncultured Roseburia sp.]